MPKEIVYLYEDRTFKLRVFSTLYIDWGLEICELLEGGIAPVFYNPSCISADSAGFSYDTDKYMSMEEVEDTEDLIEWESTDWREYLLQNAEVFIEAYTDVGELE